MPPRAVVVVGTRPEAIKMSPVVRALAASGRFAPTGLAENALGLQDFLEQTPDARALWLIHPNPNVSRLLDEVPAARIVAALTTPTSLPG